MKLKVDFDCGNVGDKYCWTVTDKCKYLKWQLRSFGGGYTCTIFGHDFPFGQSKGLKRLSRCIKSEVNE